MNYKNFPFSSAEYVVLHGIRQQKRGHNPSLSYLLEKNPRKAFALAESLAYFPENEKGYLSDVSLPEYICTECGGSECKLWRPYQTSNPELLCAICAGKSQNKSIENINDGGMITGEMGTTDQIGWYIPAVPTEDGKTYWGYTSVPGPAVDWWKKLRTLPLVKDKKESLEKVS